MDLKTALPRRSVSLTLIGAVTIAALAAWFALRQAPAHALTPGEARQALEAMSRSALGSDIDFERKLLALADVGRHDEVIALWEARIRRIGHPPSASESAPGTLHEILANAYASLGNTAEAVRAFNTAAFCFEAEAPEHALKLSYQALELDPHDSQALRRAARLDY